MILPAMAIISATPAGGPDRVLVRTATGYAVARAWVRVYPVTLRKLG